jgi:hypothetical protein
MGTAQAAAHQAQHQSRPGRAALVIDNLADLHGPAEGTVELPLRLFWHPDRAFRMFDLADPFMLRWMYQTVLREAIYPEELVTYLNGEKLVAIWPDLYLPRGVRQAWEEHHPILRAARARAA